MSHIYADSEQARREVSVLASDEERDNVAGQLREHCSDGRLNLDEFTERLGAVYIARTRAELDALMADLPHPVVASQGSAAARAPRQRARSCSCWCWW